MSQYQTLYRKYRSQTFSDLVGQDAIVRALQGALASDRVAHAYLFSGSRGTGKTSTARLLAKAVNCFERAPGSSEPCNRCESCLEVAAGSALDLIEIDAASNRGIDEIRDLREKVHLAPALGGRKVYIIDEAHMLTTEAFNALLKTLEEPPAHVVFILCTTEAQKVPLTVLGRCQQFHFRRHTEPQIVARLTDVAGREGIGIEPAALELIARTAQGSMRDAVGLLDQLVPLSTGPISLEGARELLGIADPSRVGELIDLMLGGRGREAVAALDRMYQGGAELRQVVRAVMERVRDLLLDAIDARDERRRAQLSGVLDALLHLDGEIRRHAEPHFLVEATVVRLAVEAAGMGATTQTVAISPPAPPAPPEVAATPAPAPPEVAAPAAASAPEVVAMAAEPMPSVSTREPAVEVKVEVSAGQPAGTDLAGWQLVLEQIHPLRRGFFRDARPELEGTTLVLWFPYSFHHQKASNHRDEIEPLIRIWLGEGTNLDLRLQESGSRPARPTTAPGTVRPAGGNGPVETPRASAPEEHPMIKDIVKTLEGRVTRVREIRS